MSSSMNTPTLGMSSREFIKITIDGKVIKGNSTVENCSDYFEGNSPQAFRAFAGIDGAVFDLTTLKLKVTKQIQEVIEHFFKRGEKEIVIEILRRESTKTNSAYSSYKITYNGCRLHDIMLAHDHDTNLYIELSFTPEESVAIELHVPSNDGKKTEKLGPITYNLYKETLV